MGTVELLFLAIGLSMDAFAVAVSIGLTTPATGLKKSLIVGLYFGVFQAIMPLIGFLAARNFAEFIDPFSQWVAFGLLTFLGARMIYSGFKGDDTGANASFSPRHMLPLALATSIDALAVGVSLAFLYVNIVPAITFIGIVTFVVSAAGVGVGKVLGEKFKSKAAFLGGVILIFIGVQILLGS